MTDNKISLQQAIFQISNLTDELHREEYRLASEFTGPISQNGKNAVNDDMKNEAKEVLDKIEAIIKELLMLKNALNRANNQEINGRTIISLIDEVKEKRFLLQQIDAALQSKRTSVETGVGIVQYGPFHEELYRKKRDELSREVMQLSTKIDELNSSTFISLT